MRSPYTSFGIGELQGTANTGHNLMGGIGIGGGSQRYLNTRNVAWLTRQNFTSYQVGAQGEIRTLITDSLADQVNAAGLVDLGFHFPIMRRDNFRWSMGVGLRPYTLMSYNQSRTDSIDGIFDVGQFTSRGSGGINEIFMGHGFQLPYGFHIGVQAQYLFGATIRESIFNFTLEDGGASSASALYQRLEINGLRFGAGFGYELELSEDQQLRFGLVYDFAANLPAVEFQRLEQRNGQDQFVDADTLGGIDGLGVSLPAKLGVGLAYEISRKLIVGVDYEQQAWSQYRGPDGATDPLLGDQWKISTGLQYTPDLRSTSFLQRVGYSAGFSFEKTPLVAESVQLNDFGINFGFSVPVSRLESSVNLGVRFGSRGTVEQSLVRENYVRMYLGFAYNQLWFIKSKYD